MLDMKEAVTYTGIGDKTLRKYVERGRVQATKKGRIYLFEREELDKLLPPGARTQQDISYQESPVQETASVEMSVPSFGPLKEILGTLRDGLISATESNTQMFHEYKTVADKVIDRVISSNEKKEIEEFTQATIKAVETILYNFAIMQVGYMRTHKTNGSQVVDLNTLLNDFLQAIKKDMPPLPFPLPDDKTMRDIIRQAYLSEPSSSKIA